MSYCRWSDESDVYMYPTCGPTEDRAYNGADFDAIVCCACGLSKRRDPENDDLPMDWIVLEKPSRTHRFLDAMYAEALAHLSEHIAAGHKVPQHALDRLNREWEEAKNE